MRLWGLQYHTLACIYRLPQPMLEQMLRDQPKDEGVWLEQREMFISQGEGVVGVYDELYALEEDLYAEDWDGESEFLEEPRV